MASYCLKPNHQFQSDCSTPSATVGCAQQRAQTEHRECECEDNLKSAKHSVPVEHPAGAQRMGVQGSTKSTKPNSKVLRRCCSVSPRPLIQPPRLLLRETEIHYLFCGGKKQKSSNKVNGASAASTVCYDTFLHFTNHHSSIRVNCPVLNGGAPRSQVHVLFAINS